MRLRGLCEWMHELLCRRIEWLGYVVIGVNADGEATQRARLTG